MTRIWLDAIEWCVSVTDSNLYDLIKTCFFSSFSEAKKSRHSTDTDEELKLLFPRGCDIMGVATPGIVCKCSFFISLFMEGKYVGHKDDIFTTRQTYRQKFCLDSLTRQQFQCINIRSCWIQIGTLEFPSKVSVYFAIGVQMYSCLKFLHYRKL